jgi:hypothetical protein
MEEDGHLHAPAALHQAPNEVNAGWDMKPVRTPWKEKNPCPCWESNPGRPVNGYFCTVRTIQHYKSVFYENIYRWVNFWETFYWIFVSKFLTFVGLYDKTTLITHFHIIFVMARTFQFAKFCTFSVIRFDICKKMLKAQSDIRCNGVDWIHLAQDRDQWWALLSTVINFRAP